MPVHFRSKKWCYFCESNTKCGEYPQTYCKNGHYIVHQDLEVECLQPKSDGTNISSKNTYRYLNIRGIFCTKDGERI